LQEDKERLFDTADTVRACLRMMAAMLANTTVKAGACAAAAEDPQLLATDLADYLVGKGMAFRQAHHVVGAVVAFAEKRGKRLDEITLPELRAIHALFEQDAGEVFKLGIPLTAKLTPLEFGGGWRFESRRRPSRIVPYVGASVISLKYTETSSFADSSENVDATYTGFGVFGGADVRIAKQTFGGVEAQYRSIKITPGANSAAGSFNEKDLGGAVLRVRVGIRF